VINVGGQKVYQKVYPEEVEKVVTQHPDVLNARVWPRKNPMTGSVIVAAIVLRGQLDATLFESITSSLRAGCQRALAPYKVPVTWRQIEKIDMTLSGKMQRKEC